MTQARAKLKVPARWYRGDEVSRSVIRRFARQVADRFQPDKIVLFGSHADGTPHQDSDVDILVIMHTRNRRHAAVSIRSAIPTPFAMDLLVRTPEYVQGRLQRGDSFLKDILSRGVVLHEKDHRCHTIRIWAPCVAAC
jgi:predicted nucleotidyltransferase